MSPFERRPALRFALLLSVGILVARFLPLDPSIIFWVAVVVFTGAIILSIFSSRHHTANFFVAGLVLLLGVLLQTLQREHYAERRLIPAREDEEIWLTGRLVEEPFLRQPRFQLVVETDRIVRMQRSVEAERRILVHGSMSSFRGMVDSLHAGSKIALAGLLDDFPRPRNPGEFDYGRYLELNDIHGVVSLNNYSKLVVLGKEAHSDFRSLFRRARSSLLTLVDRLHQPREAGFLRGILLAERSKIANDVRQAFVDTGTVHVLAVSGLHVGVVAVVFYGFFGLLRLPRKWIAGTTIMGLLAYMTLIGSPPSVVRATIMAIVLLLGPLFERKIDVYQSLAVAASLLLLWDSNNLFNVGFQLSFAAVISIVYLYPILIKVLPRIPERFEEVKMLEPVLKLFAVSLAAQLGTLPFTAYYFDRIPLVSLLANLLVVPLVGLNVMLGFATLGFSWISIWIAEHYAALNEWLVTFLLGFVKAASSVPFAYLESSNVTIVTALAYYTALVGIVNIGQRTVVKTSAMILLATGTVLFCTQWVLARNAVLRVTVLDVGQGDAIFIEFPNGASVLVDAGPRVPGYDAGERIVVPFLKYRGVRSLDAVIMSHPHSDHIGGIPAVLKSAEVRRVVEPAVAGETELYREVHRVAQMFNIPVVRRGAGDTINIERNTRLYVLHPYAELDSTSNLNNASLVVKLVYGQTELLLMGDAEAEVERKLLRRYAPMLDADLLKVGHHGSITSTTEQFVTLVRAQLALISVGRKNKFHHPSPAVIERLEHLGARVFRTDYHGAIILESDGVKFSIKHWRE
jgi:competence protein ComEC